MAYLGPCSGLPRLKLQSQPGGGLNQCSGSSSELIQVVSRIQFLAAGELREFHLLQDQRECLTDASLSF